MRRTTLDTRTELRADFAVSGDWSVYLVRPLTDDARRHLTAVLPDDAQFFGDAVAVEHRYVREFAAALAADGYTFERRS